MLIRAQQSLEEINREKRDDKDVEGYCALSGHKLMFCLTNIVWMKEITFRFAHGVVSPTFINYKLFMSGNVGTSITLKLAVFYK